MTRSSNIDSLTDDGVVGPFQQRVAEWAQECFPPTVVMDRLERRDRLVEECLELAQTLPDFTADRAHALVDYVFSRPVGVTEQESGGVSVTHAALCHAEGIDQAYWAEVELARISAPEVIEKIRTKQASKPVGSALPVPSPQTNVSQAELVSALEDARDLVAKLYCASGCSCCRDDEGWDAASNALGALFSVPRYSDDSGHDWRSVRDAALSRVKGEKP